MKIAFVYNLRHVKPSLGSKQAQEEAEFDTAETIGGIKAALEKKGYEVFPVETNAQTYENFRENRKRFEIVFNYSEGIGGKDREAQIPAILEILKIPYTGSSPLTSAILLNKARTKELLNFYGIKTAPWFLVHPNRKNPDLHSLVSQSLDHLKFPLIVKPNLEGSSKGIFNDNLVTDREELTKVLGRTLKDFRQGVLIEEFLPGREFTVPMLMNRGKWDVLPIIEVRFDELPKKMNPIDSYEAKWIFDSPEKGHDPLVCPADITGKLRKVIEEMAVRACEHLEILDWCRIDIRLDSRGVPNILEINSPPGIIPDPKENSRYPRAARAAGIGFEDLLDKIIKSALFRYRKLE